MIGVDQAGEGVEVARPTPLSDVVRQEMGALDVPQLRAFAISLFKWAGTDRETLAKAFRCSVSELDRASRVPTLDVAEIMRRRPAAQ